MNLNPLYAETLKRDPDYDWGDIMPPYVFAEVELGLQLYDWQVHALDAIGQRLPTALCAANETGKTTFIIAPAILWFLKTYGAAGGKVVLTSGSWLQVRTQLAPSIRRFRGRFPGWVFLDSEIKREGSLDPQVIMFSTDNAGRAEGHHALDKERAPLFYIVDEAKTVPDSIFTAVDRCGPQFCLFTSSPGPSSGKFYRCFGKERALWWTKRVRSVECPHISEEKRKRDLATYGPQHPIYLSMHEAEFTDLEGRMLIQPADLRACLEEPPVPANGPTVAFCDFAAGGDENVLAIREGNRVWVEAAWRERDTIQAARHFINLFEKRGLFPSQIFGDESGLGHVMIDAMHDEGWSINRVNNGAAAIDTEHYQDRGTEIWMLASRAIEKKEIILPDDPTFFEQATDRKLLYGSKGKLKAEPKDDMAERGVTSPDRADAVCGAIACGPHLAGIISDTSGIRLQKSTFNRPSRTRGKRGTFN